jgi:hypothetical protein
VLDEPAVGKGGCSKAYIKVSVDGIDLGYSMTLGPSDRPRLLGIFQRKNGICKETALRFAKPRVSWETQTGLGPASTAATMTGTVSVQFYVPIFSGFSVLPDLQGAELSSQPTVVVPGNTEDVSGTKKNVRSAQGSFSKSCGESGTYKYYRPGALLETITMKYCTAFGLIHAGVLPKPPMWEYARMTNPQNKPVDPEILSLQPKKITFDAVSRDGICCMPAKEYDLYDLMHLEDD